LALGFSAVHNAAAGVQQVIPTVQRKEGSSWNSFAPSPCRSPACAGRGEASLRDIGLASLATADYGVDVVGVEPPPPEPPPDFFFGFFFVVFAADGLTTFVVGVLVTFGAGGCKVS
jgi:hypothetical protein